MRGALALPHPARAGSVRPRLRLQKIKVAGATAYPSAPKIAFKSGESTPGAQMAFGPGAVSGDDGSAF